MTRGLGVCRSRVQGYTGPNGGTCVACGAGELRRGRMSAVPVVRGCVVMLPSVVLCVNQASLASLLPEDSQRVLTCLHAAPWCTGTYKVAAGNASCSPCPSNAISPAGSVGIQACLCNPVSAPGEREGCTERKGEGGRGAGSSFPPSLLLFLLPASPVQRRSGDVCRWTRSARVSWCWSSLSFLLLHHLSVLSLNLSLTLCLSLHLYLHLSFPGPQCYSFPPPPWRGEMAAFVR
jgi:hypothetical protein